MSIKQIICDKVSQGGMVDSWIWVDLLPLINTVRGFPFGLFLVNTLCIIFFNFLLFYFFFSSFFSSAASSLLLLSGLLLLDIVFQSVKALIWLLVSVSMRNIGTSGR